MEFSIKLACRVLDALENKLTLKFILGDLKHFYTMLVSLSPTPAQTQLNSIWAGLR